jgi:hypothetical protein
VTIVGLVLFFTAVTVALRPDESKLTSVLGFTFHDTALFVALAGSIIAVSSMVLGKLATVLLK